MSILFHPEAVAELEEATRIYFGIDPVLGVGFRNEVERTIGRFPYHLIFLKEESALKVIAMAHNRRQPHFWADRLNHDDLS